jgi:hypothetical protein
LTDGTITSSLAVNTDPAGNSFTPVSGNTVTLDQDTGEQMPIYSALDDPNGVGGTDAVGINNQGVVVGNYWSAGRAHNYGFIYDPTTGAYLTLDDPLSATG